MVNRTANNFISGVLPYLLLSVALILGYQGSESARNVFHSAAVIGVPVHFFAALPSSSWRVMQGKLSPVDEIRRDYVALRKHNLILQARLKRFDFLESENMRLRGLLDAKPLLSEQVILASIIEVNPDPRKQRILINKGSADGIYEGQPVVDSKGVIGQVTNRGLFRSTVSLLTENNQAVPVQIVRNGLRAVVYGGGHNRPLRVLYLDRNADVQTGDLLVASGLGGRYPVGYPVAKVTAVESNLAEPFMSISAEAESLLGSLRDVLVLWLNDDHSTSEVAGEAGEKID